MEKIKKLFKSERQYREFVRYIEDNGFKPIINYPKFALKAATRFIYETRS